MTLDPHKMCFGLTTELDRESMSCFLQLLGRKELADTVATRLSSDEIDKFVQFATELLKKTMSEDEYHELFLCEKSPH